LKREKREIEYFYFGGGGAASRRRVATPFNGLIQGGRYSPSACRSPQKEKINSISIISHKNINETSTTFHSAILFGFIKREKREIE